MTDSEATDEIAIDDFFDVLDAQGRPVVTASEVARAVNCSHSAAEDALEQLREADRIARVNVETDPVVWFPADWKDTTDRERIVVFPDRREIIVDHPDQFTRARLSSFARLADTNRHDGYRYELRSADIWRAPFDSLDDLLATVRGTLGDRYDALEDWIHDQWARAHKFRLTTHEDGYVVLTAESPDLLGNVAEPKLPPAALRAKISDTEAWVADEATATVKRTLYDAGYPVQDDRDLDTGDPLSLELTPSLRPYQRTWLDRFLENQSGILVGPPGSGKTIAALGIMAAVGGEALILVPSRDLADQWRDELHAQTSLAPDQIGMYHGGEKTIRPVTIATYQTAGMDRHRALFDDRKWGLIIYDEVHHISSPIFRRTANLQTQHRLGLSVHGDTILPIREDGNVEMIRIEELATEYLDDNPGIEPLYGIETLAVTKDGRIRWTDIQSVMRHVNRKNLYRVRARNGREVTVTEDHSLIVFDGKAVELVEKTPDELADTDYLLQPASLPGDLNGHDHINVMELIDEGYVLIDDDAPSSLFDPLYERGIGSNKDRYNWKSRRNLPIDVARDIDIEQKYITGIYTYLRDKYIPPTVNIEDFARLVGLFVADGVLDKNRVEFYATDTDDYSEVAEFKGLIRNVLPEATINTVANGENCTTVRVGGPLVKIFRRIGLANGARNKSIPPIILSNPSAYEPFVEGIVLGDGHRQDRSRNRSMITISTSSDRVLQGLNLILSALGYIGGNYCRDTNVDIRPGEHDTIKNNLVRFNPRNKDKQPRLSMTPFTEPLQNKFDDIERYEVDGGPTIKSGISTRRRLNDEEMQLLAERSMGVPFQLLAENDLGLLDVDTVEQTESQEYVYDISTEEDNFLGNHLFCHNSSTPIREDDKEDDIYTLIGPPIGTDWEALFDAGYVAEPEVEIRYVAWQHDEARNAYVSAENHERRQLAAMNPAKIDEIKTILRTNPGVKALIFVEYLDQGDAIAEALSIPFVSGETPHTHRRRLFEEFRTGPRDALVVSRVGDEGLDLPAAGLAISASGLGGSRRQGAQRAGRTMRPVGRARMIVLATRGTVEEDFARQRMRHLASKGVRVQETDAHIEE